MVDALVSYAVQRLGKYIEDDVVFLRGVKSDAKWLMDELRSMQSFLKLAEERQYKYDTLRLWVSDIGELACDIEDTLDDFHLEFNRNEETSTRKKEAIDKFVFKCKQVFNKGKKVVELHNMGEEIQSFKKRIQDLTDRRQRFQLPDCSSSSRMEDLRVIRHYTSEEDIVGFEDEAQELLDKLLDAKETRRSVISIYAMGGSGKTTLTRKLHSNDRVKEKFVIRAWVTVSKDYEIRDLLLRIFMSLRTGSDSIVTCCQVMHPEDIILDVEQLQSNIHVLLKENSYLVVIDDVWDKKVWPMLEKFLPNNDNGSRVIITTRYKEVAENSDLNITHVHPLRKLKPNESWQLFYEEVSRNLNKDEQLQLLVKY